jgi:pimeloyl-ACP methyl ester carboxylesterase
MRRLRVLVWPAAIVGVLIAPVRTGTVQALDGIWEGALTSDVARLDLRVVFSTGASGLKGTIDVPEQYIEAFALRNIRSDSAKLHFELAMAREPDSFDADVTGDVIAGTYAGYFHQGTKRVAKLRLQRVKPKPSLFSQEEVRFVNGDVALAGTVFVPNRPGRHPAVVFLHGSGPQTRESYLRFFAARFAEQGFATLVYDKRGSGASTGTPWYQTGDRFDDLTADALAGIKYLSERADIERTRIGVWGLSQGAWLAAMAATRSSSVAFAMVLSGGGVTVAEQEYYDDEIKLKDLGFPAADVEQAVALLKLADDVIRGRASWDTFATARAEAEKKPWYGPLDRYPAKLPKEDDTWRAGAAGLDADPVLLWRKIKIPVLAIVGANDKSSPPAETARRISDALRTAGNTRSTVKIFDRADHGLWVPPADMARDWERPAPGFLDLMRTWLEALWPRRQVNHL